MTCRRLQNLKGDSTIVSIKLPIDRIKPALIHLTQSQSKQSGMVRSEPIAGRTLSPERLAPRNSNIGSHGVMGDEGTSMDGQRIAFVTAGWPPTGSGSQYAERFRF